MSAGACKYVRVAFNRLFRATFFLVFFVAVVFVFIFALVSLV